MIIKGKEQQRMDPPRLATIKRVPHKRSFYAAGILLGNKDLGNKASGNKDQCRSTNNSERREGVPCF